MKSKILIMLTLVLLLVSCSSNGEYVKLSADDASERLSKENVILLDVRTQAEYDEAHIEGSTLLSLDEIGEATIKVLTDKEAVIFVYCRSGNRSKQAAIQLIELGYKKVFDIGGIMELKNNPYFADKIISD